MPGENVNAQLIQWFQKLSTYKIELPFQGSMGNRTNILRYSIQGQPIFLATMWSGNSTRLLTAGIGWMLYRSGNVAGANSFCCRACKGHTQGLFGAAEEAPQRSSY